MRKSRCGLPRTSVTFAYAKLWSPDLVVSLNQTMEGGPPDTFSASIKSYTDSKFVKRRGRKLRVCSYSIQYFFMKITSQPCWSPSRRQATTKLWTLWAYRASNWFISGRILSLHSLKGFWFNFSRLEADQLTCFKGSRPYKMTLWLAKIPLSQDVMARVSIFSLNELAALLYCGSTGVQKGILE